MLFFVLGEPGIRSQVFIRLIWLSLLITFLVLCLLASEGRMLFFILEEPGGEPVASLLSHPPASHTILNNALSSSQHTENRGKEKKSNIEIVISEQSLDAVKHSNCSDYFHKFYIGFFLFSSIFVCYRLSSRTLFNIQNLLYFFAHVFCFAYGIMKYCCTSNIFDCLWYLHTREFL